MSSLKEKSESVRKKTNNLGSDTNQAVRSQKMVRFVSRLKVPVNNFSVRSGRSQLFLGLSSTVGS